MKRFGIWMALAAAGLSAAMAGDWPQFRGPSGSGIGDGAAPALLGGPQRVWREVSAGRPERPRLHGSARSPGAHRG
jgi:hypothetical protein